MSVDSRSDGIVEGRACLDPHAGVHVEIEASHLGMAVSPSAYRAVAEALALFARADGSRERRACRRPWTKPLMRHTVRVGNCGPLLELSDVQRRLNLAVGGDGGLQTIAIADIVGTQDRCCDFDREFHPMREGLAARIQAVARAFPAGDFPPVDVVKVDRAYFLVDGHKRVAAARARGVELIDARVRRFETRHPVDAETTSADLVRLEACERFLAESGLGRARPKAEVDASSPESYHEMLEVVKAHGYDLAREEGRLVSDEDVAAHWHDCDLVPTLAAVEAAGLSERLGSCPSGELYLAVHRQARTIARFDCESIEASVAAAVERVGDSGARGPRWRRWVSRRA